MDAAISGAGSQNCRFVARLGLAVGGKSGGFAQGFKQRRVSLALFGDASHGGFSRARICNRFSDAAFNGIMPLQNAVSFVKIAIGKIAVTHGFMPEITFGVIAIAIG